MGQRSTGLRLLFLVAALWCGGALPSRASGNEPRLEFAQVLGAPGRLEDRVRFWVDVFTRYSVQQAIVQDRDRPWVVFAVVPIERPSRLELARVRAEYEDLAARVHRALDRPGSPAAKTLVGEGGEAWRRLLPPVGPEAFAEARHRLEVRPGQREIFLDSLSRSRPFLGAMMGLVRAAGLPEEIAFLPHVESSFNADARSNVGAVGIWQLMPETARRTLRVGGGIDERRDPVRSTHAATRYFRDAFEALGSWPLAVTSYNYGVNGMRRAVEALGTTDLVDLIERHDSPAFGYSAKNFFAQFLAAVHVARHEAFYFPPRARTQIASARTSAAFADGARCRGPGGEPSALFDLPTAPAIALGDANLPAALATPAPPNLAALDRGRSRGATGGGRSAHAASRTAGGAPLPGGTAIARADAVARSATARATPDAVARRDAPPPREHLVRKGDSLWTIARRHGTTVEAIRQANRDVSPSAQLHLGQRLRIEG
ncbi:transglycosylase SLT domain-containing protein [bacterium]|nr:transglycosylase SLT domain-containing protein [bacterium]